MLIKFESYELTFIEVAKDIHIYIYIFFFWGGGRCCDLNNKTEELLGMGNKSFTMGKSEKINGKFNTHLSYL